MSGELIIRPVSVRDVKSIAAIYNQGVEDRLATFETDPRSEDDVRAWLAAGLPFVIAVRDEEIVGFARVGPYSDRCVYDGVGEHGVYVAREARGQRTGRRLLEALAAAAETAGFGRTASSLSA